MRFMSLSPKHSAWRRPALLCAIVVLVVAVLAACVPDGPVLSTLPSTMDQGQLTRDGTDSYAVTSIGSTYRVTAASTNTDSNTRALFWTKNAPVKSNQQACETFTDTSLPTQEGVALRITKNGTTTTALTVTKNIVYNATWIFNVHKWNSAAQPVPFSQFGGFDMTTAMRPGGKLVAYPWRLCVRVVGSTLTFKVWPASKTEPGWTNATYTRSVAIPAGSPTSGRTGVYIGHLPPGARADFSNLASKAL